MKPRTPLGLPLRYLVAAAAFFFMLLAVVLRISLSSPAAVATASIPVAPAIAVTAGLAPPPETMAAALPLSAPRRADDGDGKTEEDDPRFTEEPDPYPQNEIDLPAGAEDGLVHPVASDIKTGADIEAELSERTGGAYVADNPYGPPPDDLPDAEEASNEADREPSSPAAQ